MSDETPIGRNPSWERDELILALDLYLRRHGQVASNDPEVLQLSALLGRLPIHASRPDPSRFRNPNGVALKLANFAALDVQYAGRGMVRHGMRDVEVWDALASQPALVHQLAEAIRAEVSLGPALPLVEGEEEAYEGRLLFRRHRARERSRHLVARMKERAMAKTGCLACEICGFDFAATYGSWGEGFIECHHLVPLSTVAGPTRTRLIDLALVCANCHRVLHQGHPPPTVAQVRDRLGRS